MVKVSRSGDDSVKLDEMIARAKARGRFAESFVAFPNSEFWTQLVRKTLLTKVFMGEGGVLLRMRPGEINAYARKAAAEAAAEEEPEALAVAAEEVEEVPPPEIPKFEFYDRTRKIWVQDSLYLTSTPDDEIEIVVRMFEPQIEVSDGLPLQTNAGMFYVDVSSALGLLGMGDIGQKLIDTYDYIVLAGGGNLGLFGVAVEDYLAIRGIGSGGTLLASADSMLALGTSRDLSATYYVSVDSNLALSTSRAVEHVLSFEQSTGLRLSAAATADMVLAAQAESRLALKDDRFLQNLMFIEVSSGLRVGTQPPEHRWTLYASAQSALSTRDSHEVRTNLRVSQSTGVRVRNTAPAFRMTLVVSKQELLRLSATTDVKKVLYALAESLLKIKSEWVDGRITLNASADSRLAVSSQAQTVDIIEMIDLNVPTVQSGLRLSTEAAIALGLRPPLEVSASTGVRINTPTPSRTMSIRPNLNRTQNVYLRLSTQATVVQGPRPDLAAAGQSALRLGSAATPLLGPKPDLFVAQDTPLRVATPTPTIVLGGRLGLIAGTRQSALRVSASTTVALGARPNLSRTGTIGQVRLSTPSPTISLGARPTLSVNQNTGVRVRAANTDQDVVLGPVPNKIPNPGCDTTSGWSVTSNGSLSVVSGGYIGNCFRVFMNQTMDYCYVYPTAGVLISVTGTYRLSWWARTIAGGNYPTQGCSTTLSADMIIFSRQFQSYFVQYYKDYALTAGVRYYPLVGGYVSNEVTQYIDEVSLVQIA